LAPRAAAEGHRAFWASGWASGPVVRLELLRDDNGNSLDAEISRDRYRQLALAVGDKVDVTPRNLRTFPA